MWFQDEDHLYDDYGLDDYDNEEYSYEVPTDALASFEEMLANGKAAHDKKDYQAAKELYHKAKDIMVSLMSSYHYSITAEDRAILLYRVAENELALGNLTVGMNAARHSVDCEETAEGYKCLADGFVIMAKITPSCKNYSMQQYQSLYEAVRSYIKSYSIEHNNDVYCKALLHAVDINYTEKLPKRKDYIPVISKLLESEYVKGHHLEFLFNHDFSPNKKYLALPNSGMAYGQCNTSCIQLASLLQKLELSYNLIEILLRHGTLSCPKSIEYALSQNNYKLFELLTVKYTKLENSNFTFLDCSLLVSKFHQIGPKFLTKLLQKGCKVSGINPKLPTPLECAVDREKYDLAVVLIDYGARLAEIKVAKSTTIVHEATKISLHTGKISVLIHALASTKLPEDGKVVDGKGQLPHHIAVVENTKYSKDVLELLCRNTFDVTVKDQNNKTALDYCMKKRDHLKVILKGSTTKSCKGKSSGTKQTDEENKHKEPTNSPKQKTAVTSIATSSAVTTTANVSAATTTTTLPTMSTSAKTKPATSDQPITTDNENTADKVAPVAKLNLVDIEEQAKAMVENILRESDEYFELCVAVDTAENEVSTNFMAQRSMDATLNYDNSDHDETISNLDTSENVCSGLFQGCSWEVECTESVWRMLSNLSKPQRRVAFDRILCLARGEWHHEFHSSLNHHKLHLYKLQLPGDVCIIWELAIAYSPRCTQSQYPSASRQKETLFSEIIRVWSVITNSKDIVGHVMQIEKSHVRGQQSAVIQKLLPKMQPSKSGNCKKDRIPKFFYAVTDTSGTGLQTFYPPASHKENEYNIVTFYPVTDEFLVNLMCSDNPRRDFLFKVCQEEHDIINMNQEESVLLLGRSGTGKTTCCLYRLWNQFRQFWEVSNEPRIPRTPLIKPLLCEPPVAGEGDATDAAEEEAIAKPVRTTVPIEPMRLSVSSEHSLGSVALSQDSHSPSVNDMADILRYGDDIESWPDSDWMSEEEEECVDGVAASPGSDNAVDFDETITYKEDHLQQVFITKNSVLCSQFKKKFFDLAHTVPVLSEHIEYEDVQCPTTLQEIIPLAYPLFLTFRDWLELLDASLEDNASFFPRDPSGQLTVEILDMDYNYNKSIEALVMLDESSSEDEDETVDNSKHPLPTESVTVKQRKVDANFFINTMWSKVSKAVPHSRTQIKPILVWMEIKSFIKGSTQALKSPTGCLSLEEYRNFGKKMAPNFANDRDTAYQLFQYYEDIKNRSGFFDDCDLVFNLFQRLSKLDDVNWCVHEFYIDEVQDFTQAELTLLLHCCRWPNGLFLTGDTAQSIMRGVSFRFSDLRSVFHYISKHVDTSKGQRAKVKVPRVHKLTQNFRSHSGILQLAASVIDLLMNFFRSSLDKLPGDQGMFPGPKPVLLLSCSYSDLALLLRGNRREASAIEFGARQAIIVQSEKAKESLPSELKTGIVLTVFESKGLEFDDVLLYNFFTDSKADKEWRVVTSYLLKHPELIFQNQNVVEEPRPLEFDERQHKMLNSELKFLYTAFTRAKCNLWIYDSNSTKRAPMFHYFQKRDLVKVVTADSSNDIQQSNMQSMFAIVSAPEEWRRQGEYFKKKYLWDLAVVCFNKAGMPELACEAYAYSSVLLGNKHKNDSKLMKEHFLNATINFFKCLQLQQSAKWIRMAALCLFNAREYGQAAPLFAKIRQDDYAIKAYQKCGNFQEVASIQLRQGNIDDAIQSLLSGRLFPAALELAATYSRDPYARPLRPECSLIEVAHLAADYYISIKNKNLAVECVKEYFDKAKEKVNFFKENGFIQEAIYVLCQEQQFDDVYRLLKAQGMFSKGAKKCVEQKDYLNNCVFHLLSVKSKLYCSDSGENSYDQKARSKDIAELENASKKIKDLELKLEIELFIDILKSSAEDCMKVSKKFRNQFGIVEAMNASLKLSSMIQLKSVDTILKCLQDAKSIVDSFKENFLPFRAAGELLKFYGFEKSGDRYFLPPQQYYWLPQLAKHSFEKRDSDGMIQLRESDVHRTVHEHVLNSARQWLDTCKLDELLYATINADKYKQLNAAIMKPDKDFAPLCTQCEDLSAYICCCAQLIELGSFYRYLDCKLTIKGDGGFRSVEHMINYGASRIVNIFSNQWNIYLPIKRTDIEKVRSVEFACLEMNRTIDRFVEKKQYEPTLNINGFLYKWHIRKVTASDVSELENLLKEKEVAYSKTDHKKPKTQLPPEVMFIEERQGESYVYVHSFTMWIRAHGLLVTHGNFIEFASTLIRKFVLVNAQYREIEAKISVLNAVSLLEVVSVGLLAMLQASAVHLEHEEVSVVLPELYSHAVEFFDMINCSENEMHLLKAASSTVVNIPIKKLANLNRDSFKMLYLIIRLLVGLRLQYFNVLMYALARSTQNNGFERCLVLSLSLLANLAPLLTKEQVQKIRFSLCSLLNEISNDHPELKAAVYRVGAASNTTELFHVALSLQKKYNKGMVRMNYDHNKTAFEFHGIKNTTDFPSFGLDVIHDRAPSQAEYVADPSAASSKASFPVIENPSLPMRPKSSLGDSVSNPDMEVISMPSQSSMSSEQNLHTIEASLGEMVPPSSTQRSPLSGKDKGDQQVTAPNDDHTPSDHVSQTIPPSQFMITEHQLRTLITSPNFNLFTFLLNAGMTPELIQHHLLMTQQCLNQYAGQQFMGFNPMPDSFRMGHAQPTSLYHPMPAGHHPGSFVQGMVQPVPSNQDQHPTTLQYDHKMHEANLVNVGQCAQQIPPPSMKPVPLNQTFDQPPPTTKYSTPASNTVHGAVTSKAAEIPLDQNKIQAPLQLQENTKPPSVQQLGPTQQAVSTPMHSASADDDIEQIDDYSEVYTSTSQELQNNPNNISEDLHGYDKTFCLVCKTHLYQGTGSDHDETMERYDLHYISAAHKDRQLYYDQYKQTLAECKLTMDAAKDIVGTKKKCKNAKLLKKIASIDESVRRLGLASCFTEIYAEWVKGDASVKKIVTELTQLIQEYQGILEDILWQSQSSGQSADDDVALLDVGVPTKRQVH